MGLIEDRCISAYQEFRKKRYNESKSLLLQALELAEGQITENENNPFFKSRVWRIKENIKNIDILVQHEYIKDDRPSTLDNAIIENQTCFNSKQLYYYNACVHKFNSGSHYPDILDCYKKLIFSDLHSAWQISCPDANLYLKTLFLLFESAYRIQNIEYTQKVIDRIEELLIWSDRFQVLDPLIPLTYDGKLILISMLKIRLSLRVGVKQNISPVLTHFIHHDATSNSFVEQINISINSLNVCLTIKEPTEAAHHLVLFATRIAKQGRRKDFYQLYLYCYQAMINIEMERWTAASVFLNLAISCNPNLIIQNWIRVLELKIP